MQGYALTVFEPLPGTRVVSQFDINPEITQLSYSTDACGFGGLTVGLMNPDYPDFGYLPHSVAVNGYNHVTLEHNGVLVWEGRIVRAPLTGGEVNGFTAQGYGTSAMADGWYTSASTTAITAATLLRQVIATTAPLIVPAVAADEFVDSGVNYIPAQFNGLPPSQVLQRLSSDGGGGSLAADGNAAYDFLVYNRRKATFKPRVPPLTLTDVGGHELGATYWIDFDGGVTWDQDFTDCISSITVNYSGGVVTPTTFEAVSSTFVATYGFPRRIFQDLGAVTDEQAKQYARTYLSVHEVPVTAITIARSGGRGLRLASGGEQEPALVRRGEWVQVGDQQPAYIIGTQMDCNTGSFTATCENYPRGYWTALTALERFARLNSLNLNANTGAPQS